MPIGGVNVLLDPEHVLGVCYRICIYLFNRVSFRTRCWLVSGSARNYSYGVLQVVSMVCRLDSRRLAKVFDHFKIGSLFLFFVCLFGLRKHE